MRQHKGEEAVAIEKQTVLNQIEITETGVVQVRLGLRIVEDDVEIASQWYRSSIEPGVDVDECVAAINKTLSAQGKKTLREADETKIKLVVDAIHTEQTVADFRAARAKADAIA